MRLKVVILTGWIGFGCSHRYPYPDPEIVALLQRARTAAAVVAGCYALALGPWRGADSLPVDTARWDTPMDLPPPQVRLDAEDSQVPVLGHYRLTPQPVADTGFRYASWQGNRDTLILEWSREGFMQAMFEVQLRPDDTTWTGRALVTTDVKYDGPFRLVSARRVVCQ